MPLDEKRIRALLIRQFEDGIPMMGQLADVRAFPYGGKKYSARQVYEEIKAGSDLGDRLIEESIGSSVAVLVMAPSVSMASLLKPVSS